MPEAVNATYRISVAADVSPFVVTAAYPVCDDMMPGWTLFKNAEHRIVGMVRSDQALFIERVASES